MSKIIRIYFLFILLLPATSFSQETIVGMAKARAELSSSLQFIAFEGMSMEVGAIETRFREVLLSQLSFCKKPIVELNNYFVKEIEGEVDVKKIKESCLLALRKWHINTERKLFKLKRIEIKKTLDKSLAKLREIEEERMKSVVKSYKDLI